MSATQVFRVDDASQVGEVRRAVTALATHVGLDENTAGRAALVASELTSNLVKHAQRGEILLRRIGDTKRPGVELLSVDRGPGMDVERAMRDGFSTAGSRGVGLGAIARASTVFDAIAWPDVGSLVLSQIVAGRDPWPMTEGAVCVPYPGEDVSGDGYAVHELGNGDVTVVTVVDGLGHGLAAMDAAQVFLRVVERERARTPVEIITLAHAAMRSTRGAAAAVARVDWRAKSLSYAAIGNISSDVITPEGATQSLLSQHGIVGAGQLRKLHELPYDMREGSMLVLASDGLSTSWKLEKTPGLRTRHPALVAAGLYLLHRRGRDDTTVLALRRTRESP